MDVIQRSAYLDWYKANEFDDSISPWIVWQAACEWQKQQDAEICKNMVGDIDWDVSVSANEASDATASHLKHKILNQGKDNG